MNKFKYWFPPLFLLASIIIAFFAGQYTIFPTELWSAVMRIFEPVQSNAETVLWHIRIPRIITAVFVGAALAVAGATYQGIFKNPLVSPDILGVTVGAGLGAVLAIYFGLSLMMVQVVAFISGLCTVFFVFKISQIARYHDPILALVLSGIAVGALLGAGISLVKILSDPYSQLTTITFWLLGSLNMATYEDLQIAVPLIIIGIMPLLLLRWRMNLLSLNDEEAMALGINVQRTRLVFILSTTLMTSAAVSITGVIGWIGLVIPHIARLWIGADFRRLLPTALTMGAGFLVLTDTVARAVFPIEVPLGVITAFIGAPFFLSLLINGGSKK
ncbi:iron complex transport system permease protein [Cricetibacter osteomyelitidis]|uniref:Iron complex transport system permease protein n=1 Tax=Cricetibacter osteomyelitidis TaxID=1521931 RepID=A0A4V2T1Y9_9PAST|nr:iron ABC transporter permease [Cricetibacter osteomyelitidis]TCP95373.1 iron complex transport system permease protein [Cricetibacter osteomyelitidis]